MSSKFGTSVIISLFLSGAAFAGEWTSHSGQIGNEVFSIKFPNQIETKEKPGEMTLYAREGSKALYILTTCNPALPKNPKEAVQKLLIRHSTYPKVVQAHKISTKRGNTVLDIDCLNKDTLVKTKIRYIITPENVWELKTVYDKFIDNEHEAFISTFNLN